MTHPILERLHELWQGRCIIAGGPNAPIAQGIEIVHARGLREAIADIAALLAWHPADSPPDTNRDVLLRIEGGDTTCVVGSRESWEGFAPRWRFPYEADFTKPKVTHWQGLPPLPEVE